MSPPRRISKTKPNPLSSGAKPRANPKNPPQGVKKRQKDCTLIYPGDQVYIPDQPSCHFLVHRVKPGESLWRIARKFHLQASYVCSLEENRHLRVQGAEDFFKTMNLGDGKN